MRCARCQAQIRPGAAYCVGCGASAPRPAPTPPPPTRATTSAWPSDQRYVGSPLHEGPRQGRGRRSVLIVAAGVLLVAATVATTVLLLGPTPSPPTAAASTAAGIAASPTTTSSPGSTSTTPTDNPDTTTTSPGDQTAGTDPESELAAAVEADRDAVNAVAGSWVPQLSSKKPGTVADGFTYTSADILADYQRNRADYPDARLLRSSDWPVFSSPNYYVTVAAVAFSSPDQANAWCDAHYLAANDCYAKKLSHTGGPDNTTEHR